MRHRILDTFTGPFAIIQHDDGSLVTSWLSKSTRHLLDLSRRDPKLLPELARRLMSYFEGEHVDFSDVRTPSGGEFYHRCWNACRRIPRGKTLSYGELAHRAGSADAARAAGQAMRNNPLPIIVPCHRVIGSSGRLHGFGGTCNADAPELNVKTALLRMEGALPPAASRNPADSLFAQAV
ncbi:MAG: methylated-DNA--[protein]-cysteine S-methyltransferase [Phycisphaerales bacterium]|nr:methylated-DNA--[protein]-cysteine S-methyltransferase [Phycisphaerales bacterium]MCI0630313.1 methylated-DNA--[protein]-cysteine S-methyltransferase [Phycisphaerales bacterium]MCI0674706.1 methylated-DNA--[protein]-cysteine S-methyltransferase [Phycisphaerales bacterium]